MIALDLRKKLHSPALESISADGAEHCSPFRFEIVVEKNVTELAHKKPWAAHGMPYSHTVLYHTDGRYEFMSAAA
jgi:hypothetical protein